MALTRDDVKQLATLARLELSDQEVVAAERDLDSILGYVDRLSKIDTAGIEPMTMPVRAEWREDAEHDCDEMARQQIIANFPAHKGTLLKTPGVFEAPKGGR